MPHTVIQNVMQFLCNSRVCSFSYFPLSHNNIITVLVVFMLTSLHVTMFWNVQTYWRWTDNQDKRPRDAEEPSRDRDDSSKGKKMAFVWFKGTTFINFSWMIWLTVVHILSIFSICVSFVQCSVIFGSFSYAIRAHISHYQKVSAPENSSDLWCQIVMPYVGWCKHAYLGRSSKVTLVNVAQFHMISTQKLLVQISDVVWDRLS